MVHNPAAVTRWVISTSSIKLVIRKIKNLNSITKGKAATTVKSLWMVFFQVTYSRQKLSFPCNCVQTDTLEQNSIKACGFWKG